jgi:hypothetical protein
VVRWHVRCIVRLRYVNGDGQSPVRFSPVYPSKRQVVHDDLCFYMLVYVARALALRARINGKVTFKLDTRFFATFDDFRHLMGLDPTIEVSCISRTNARMPFNACGQGL